MSSRVLTSLSLAWIAESSLASQELDIAATSLAEDDECVAEDSEEHCALNALQLQTRRVAVDMDSSEGADLIESTRSWYASRGIAEADGGVTEGSSADVDQNRTQVLGARSGVAPPRSAFQYNGISWPEMTISVGPGNEAHFFAIGDWGGMDGALEPPDGFPRMITYPGGHLPGPHVFPRSRLACGHTALTNCYFGGKKYCSQSCGFAKGVDDRAQLLVAEQLKKRAARHDPKFFLNVGDNFYWGGIAKTCGHPMNHIHPATRHQFQTIFEDVYRGQGVDGKPWLSVLGNHDWGGRMFTAGWDQQIAYTWASDRWLMPAVYWHQRVNFPGYAADIYMVDSNHHDAKPKHQSRATNICGASFNPQGASCASTGGPRSVDSCKDWFEALWQEEQTWLERKMSESNVAWQIVVTHFPCDETPQFWRSLHEKHGLDLLVTGHRHDQELYKAHSGSLGGLTCFVTGGGGGISSEESPLPGTLTHGWRHVGAQYGFFDMTITQEMIKVESIDYTGKVVDTTHVHPKS